MRGDGTTAPGWEPSADPSGTVAAVAQRLRLQAVSLEEIRAGIAAAGRLDWDSPAGHNFRVYLFAQEGEAARCVELLREAAVLADALSESLRAAEQELLRQAAA